jgi:hypothetical protein
MSEQTTNPDQQAEETVSGYYDNYTETQKEILAIEIRRTRNSLFTLAAIVFASDLLGLLMLEVFLWQSLLIILIIPAILIGLSFLASKEPLTAIIIAATVIIGVWVYTIISLGAGAAITGWLVRAIIIYFLIAGLQHAREAMKIKKELGV